MAIANGTCVSFCNQPKTHYLATSRESRRYVVADASIWLRQASLSHILSYPGYPDNRDKFYMDGKRIQCLSNASQHVPKCALDSLNVAKCLHSQTAYRRDSREVAK